MLLISEKTFEKISPNIKGVIHIGAHHGQEHVLYKKYNINKMIYFEPLKDVFEILKSNIKNEGILVNKALGNENKKVTMNVEKNNQSQSSSILNPKIHLQQYNWVHFNHKEEVDMIRLDYYEGDLSLYNFINIDIQGYELEALKGAGKVLNNIDYILSEVNRAEVYEGCAHIKDLCDFLYIYGFELEEVSWAGETWGDGLFVKK